MLVVCVAALVYWAAGGESLAQSAQKRAPSAQPSAQLPPKMSFAVEELVTLLRQAVASGQIDGLKAALELNGVKPDVGANQDADVIGHLKASSADPEGYAVLAILSLLLDGPPILLPLGRDLENNRVWVWPAFAETPLARLTPTEQVQLRKLVREPELAKMRVKGKYSGPRLIIGQDGLWQAFHPG